MSNDEELFTSLVEQTDMNQNYPQKSYMYMLVQLKEARIVNL